MKRTKAATACSKLKPVSALFQFSRNDGRVIFIEFVNPTSRGQYAAVRLLIGIEWWEKEIEPGWWKPRVTDCQRVYDDFLLTGGKHLEPKGWKKWSA